MNPFLHTLVFLTLAPVAVCHAGEAGSLAALFPKEADIHVSSPGLARLDLPEEVLAGCKADLSDLRLFDRDGGEVPFAIHAGDPIGAVQSQRQAVAARILNVERSQVARDNAPPLHRENYQVAVPAKQLEGEGWEVEIRATRASFVRTVRVLAVDGSGSVTEIVGSQSLFRLAEGGEKRRIPLPSVAVPVLEIVIEGEEGSFLDPTFWFASARDVEPVQPIRIGLSEIARQQRHGQTVLHVARPGAVVPELLRIDTSTSWFDRAVKVWEEGPGMADRLLGSGRLRRTRGETSSERIELRVEPSRGQRLRIEITDGDSPPLTELAVAGIVPRPRLVWMASTAETEGVVGKLRFGGGRAYRPAYDVASLYPQDRRASEPGEGSVTGKEDVGLAAARLGEVRPNPNYDNAPLLGFALRPGAQVDIRLYRYRRPILVEPSAEGVSRLHLAAADLARARSDLGDMRVVDAEGRQWSFLIDRNTPPQPLELEVVRNSATDHVSHYTIRPQEPLPVSELRLATDVAFVDRPYRLRVTVSGAEPRLIASGRLTRDPYRGQPIVLKFAAVATESFELAIEDGDDAPIELLGASTEVELPDLLLVAPRGQYFFLVGDAEATPPQYELERVRQLVFAVDSGTVTSLELQDNPELSQTARLQRSGSASSTLQQVLVWSALVVAVVVLGLITIRIVRGVASQG